MPLYDLVAHVRSWIANPTKCPAVYYRRHLDAVHQMSDQDVADAIRFARTPRGAEMALINHLKVVAHG